MTPVVRNKKPVVFAMKFGNIGTPTTFRGLWPAPRELGVLLADEQAEMGADEQGDDRRKDEHVEDEEPRDDGVSREVASEEEEGHVAADERHRLDDREGDPDTGPGDEVVG